MAGTGGFQESSGGSGDTMENDRPHDPASSGLFGVDFKRNDDLKEMLDSSDDKKKLEAMKRIVGMVAKGKDASSLFPAVVKNVASKNLEVKKLVYVYLTRYAEEQQDLALLSIATFQRAMKDPNQLIRASALRVLSSIRVPVIVPIMMLVIKDGVNDMSPYVRKAAAHAIPKLYSVDPDQKDELICLLEKLLADKTTLVIGSAMQAFEELCPERIDLIHKNYRKLCSLLADVEEWGQIIIINMLTRYARTQFVDPNKHEGPENEEPGTQKAFYSSNEDSNSDGESPAKSLFTMDPDHRLLLRNAKPLLNSRNSAVVMAVIQLYYHCAPKSEVGLVARPMIRLLRTHKEIQYIVLTSIATMAVSRRGMFEPYIKSFYIRANDPIHVKLLKLDILTSLATESNVAVMMREFQQYVLSAEKEFASATIQAIGKIAASIADVTDGCLGGLITLLSNKSEVVVGESVVVIKKLLQMKSTGHKDIITHLAQMVDNIAIPHAKGSILWLIGEYCDKVPKIAPDVLRKAAKAFTQEEDIVKLQILNLAAKLCITNSKQTQLLCQYVFSLAKYDQSYDIRDRARFLKALILPGENAGALAKHAKKIFFVEKPAPVVENKHKERDQYQLGSLSHTINNRAHGYNELPDWPSEAPPSSVRNVELPPSNTVSAPKAKDKLKKEKGFYSESDDDDDEEESGSEEDSDDDEDEESGSEDEEEEGSDEDEEEEEEEEDSEASDESEDEESEEEQDSDEQPKSKSKRREVGSSDESESEEQSSEEDSSDDSAYEPSPKPSKPANNGLSSAQPPKNSQLLLDLLDFDQAPAAGQNTVVKSPESILQPAMANLTIESPSALSFKSIAAAYVPTETHELLNRMTSEGLSAVYRFTRSPYAYSAKMVSIEIAFTNQSDQPISNIKVGEKRLQQGMHMHEFLAVNQLAVGQTTTVLVGIDFNDTLQPADFNINTSTRSFKVKIEAPVGELIGAVTMAENEFNSRKAKLGGMNETSTSLDPSKFTLAQLHTEIIKTANVGQVPSSQDNVLLFAGQTLSNKCDILLKVVHNDSRADVTINCEKIVISSMLIKDIKLSIAGLR